jgi:Arc/MetJ-type ribon-helix-helix transcriptional regulator
LLERLDELVEGRRFRNRSRAIEAALAGKLERLARIRLARESAQQSKPGHIELAAGGVLFLHEVTEMTPAALDSRSRDPDSQAPL